MKRTRVVIIEDEPKQLSAVWAALDDDFEVFAVPSLADLIKLNCGEVDAVIMDLTLPEGNGADAVRALRRVVPDVPLVVVAERSDDAGREAARQEGAEIALEKGSFYGSLVPSAVRHAIDRHKSASHFRDVLMWAADGILIAGQDKTVHFLNPAAEKMLGKSASALLGKPFGYEFKPGEIIGIPVYDDSGKELRALEMSVGEVEWNGEPAFIASLRDVSDTKKTMRTLREYNQKLLELDVLKTNFITAVSHELRTPLTVIVSAATNLLRGALGPLLDDQKEWIGKIDRHSNRLSTLIDNILEFSRLESRMGEMNFAYADLAPLAQNAAKRAERALQTGVKIDLDLPQSLPKSCVSAEHIERVFDHLLSNAAKFTPAGGKIRVSAAATNGHLEISVADSGPGIAPELRPIVFDRLRQASKKDGTRGSQGIGLGLAICKEIINQHRGEIWVAERPGGGCDFRFKVPIEFQAVLNNGRRNVLIADDDAGIGELMKAFLTKLGYQVTLAVTGGQAIKLIEDKSRAFDLVFLDIMLPEANGVVVLKALQKAQPDAKVVVITAYPKSGLALESLRSGVTLLPKPFDLDQLEGLAHRLLTTKTSV